MDTLSKYYSIHEFSKIIGVSAQTLRNWDANGKLHPHHTTVSGYRYYSDEQLNQVINVKPKNRITIGYCRVSSHRQKDDLERQIDNVKTYLLAKGQPFEIISDIGSGINYKKKGLQELIRRISQNQVELQGKRANKAKKLIRELIQEEADGKSHKSNVDTKQCTEN